MARADGKSKRVARAAPGEGSEAEELENQGVESQNEVRAREVARVRNADYDALG
jgi:hypothetical protein